MPQNILNLLAKVAAEFNALGDEENSEKIMEAINWLIIATGMRDEAFDQANDVYDSLCDKRIADIPDNERPDDAENCIAAILEGCEDLIVGATHLEECAALLKDYWEERMQTTSDSSEE